MTPLIRNAITGGLFGFGIWLGRYLTRRSSDEVAVGWREMWRDGPSPKFRQNPRNMRVFASAFGSGFVAFVLRWISVYFDSTPLALLSVALMLVSLGTGFGAMLFNKPLRNN